MAAIVINVAGSYDNKAISQAQSALNKLKGTAEDAGKQGSTIGQKLGKGLKIAGVVGGVAAGAFAGVATTLVAFGREAQEAASVTRSTEAIIKATGGAAGVTAQQVSDLAESLSEKTGIDDEAIQSAQNLILTFKNVQNAGEGQAAMFDRATAAAADLSAAGFGSIDGAAKTLGKALNDPVKGMSALSRAGVTFTEEQKEQIKALQESGDLLGAQAVIMAEVEGQVGGVAEAAASPFDQLSVMLGNFKEEVGNAVLPAISQLVDALGPVLDQLAGPLGEIAGQLAATFSEVFASIQPLLAPLLTALTQVVGVLASGFMSAIQALVPAVVPLVTLIAELATRLAPILAPILQKVAGVLSLILEAVTPLLGPLADLILNIFAQAAPLIDLVVGVLETLVTALMPVFDAVSLLIPPLSDLVSVAFAALMPILEPLLPVLQILADILSAVLVKAVAVLMLALGGWITAMSKIAPWILENLTKPVLEFFLDMVGGILQGAEQMFGWVPGVGDKIAEANAAFGGLKDGVLAGLDQASAAIQDQGGTIGEDLVTQATAMLQDAKPPKAAASTFAGNLTAGLKANADPVVKAGTKVAEDAIGATETGVKKGKTKVQDAATDVGRGLGEGLRDEMKRQAPKVAEDAYAMGRDAADAVRAGADVRSPSRLTLYVGRMLGEGLRAGIAESRKRAVGEAERLVQDATWALADAKDAVTDAQKALAEANAEGSARDQAKAERDLEKAIRDRADATAELAAAETDLRRARAARGLSPAEMKDAVAAAAEAARAAIEPLRARGREFAEFAASIRDGLRNFGGVTQLGADAGTAPTAAGIVQQFRSRVAQVRAFGQQLRQLKALGLNNASLQQIIAAGPEAGAQIAGALLAEGRSAISEVNTLEGQFMRAAANVGAIGAESQFGITAAEARGMRGTTVNVSTLQVNFGDGVSAADRVRVRAEVERAVTAAIRKVAAEASRAGG